MSIILLVANILSSFAAGTQIKKYMNDNKKNKQSKPKVADLQAELEQQKDQYVRLMAEFDNFRRNKAKERLELIDSAGKDILTGFLPVMDDCMRALQVLKESNAEAAAIEGTELILNKLSNFLSQRGVEKINAVGEVFNTDLHEAVAQIPVQDEAQKNRVIDVTQEGYTLKGNVIRFAKVVVGV